MDRSEISIATKKTYQLTNLSNGESTNGEVVKGEVLAQNIASLKTLLAPTIPPEGQYFDVNVTFAVSPSSFVVQPYNEVGPGFSE